MANETPATSIGGQTSIILRQPTNAVISQKGTMTEKKGSWRPTMPLSSCRSSPVTAERAITGVPRAPNATGAVLAMSDSPEAASGEKPRPMRMAAVTATGVPKPAAPSKNAPREEGDEKELQAAVVADGSDRPLQDGELALFARELVEKYNVENDPADRQEAEGRAVAGREARHGNRHAVGEDGNDEPPLRDPGRR